MCALHAPARWSRSTSAWPRRTGRSHRGLGSLAALALARRAASEPKFRTVAPACQTPESFARYGMQQCHTRCDSARWHSQRALLIRATAGVVRVRQKLDARGGARGTKQRNAPPVPRQFHAWPRALPAIPNSSPSATPAQRKRPIWGALCMAPSHSLCADLAQTLTALGLAGWLAWLGWAALTHVASGDKVQARRVPWGLPVREIEVFLAWIFLRARQSRCTRACPRCPTAHRSVQRGIGARTAGCGRTAGQRWHCHWHYGVVNRGQRRRPGPAHGGQRRTQAAGRGAPPRRLRRNRTEITSERKRLHVSATLRSG